MNNLRVAAFFFLIGTIFMLIGNILLIRGAK